ncbi:type VI secretion system Vgr family protein [Chondromyces apiculatus]|uniref:VgrG protein n=1 Tax=Chondromyces apiculatus DSM 436 TaxID=1192034 RepID=A0A017TGY6_9BACT|nr:type VI secretion system tip protein TssI/VgrG [Chondromyces apiculatus]EYF08509.1 VgrG protein [Chondromyces apiculatus DSM 436]
MTRAPPLEGYDLQIEGADATWRVLRVARRERIHAPFSFELACAAEDGDGAPAEIDETVLVSAKATLTIALPEGTERTIVGIVDALECLGDDVVLTLVPSIALLEDTVDYQVFVDQDALQIIEAVLGERGITTDRRVVRALAKRSQCVQAFESVLAFVSRLCAEEGITWYLPRDAADQIVLSDSPGGFDDHEGVPELPVRGGAGLVSGESVFDASLTGVLVSDRVALSDYDFEKPSFDLAVKSEGEGARERYEFPGHYLDPDVGVALAEIRLEQYNGRETVLRAKTTSQRLVPGYVVTLHDPERDEVSGRWLVLEVRDEISTGPDGLAHTSEIVAVPAAHGYRAPPGEAPPPGGVQTAIVTGTPGAEISADRYGRVTVFHRWDRRRPRDDTSSAAQRAVQPPLSGGFMQPRVGWEVLIGFCGLSGDPPFILGRVANATSPPPSSLPGYKVVSAFGSSSTPGGGSANLIETDDSAGNEAMNFVASKDWSERTESDKKTTIKADDTWNVAADRTLIVGKVLSNTVGGAQSYAIGANRTVNVTSNHLIHAASESVAIGGLRTFNVGGDHGASAATLSRLVGAAKAEAAIESSNRAVKGPSMVVVGASWNTVAGASANVSVLGASTEVVSGQKSIKASRVAMNVKGVMRETLASRTVTAGADRTESFAAAASYKVGGSANLKGSEITVRATAKITLKAGGVTIQITPSTITITGNVKSATENEDKGEAHYR